MNERVDLNKILKDCPKGWEFYSSIHGVVNFEELNTSDKYPVIISYKNGKLESFGADGRLFLDYAGECVLFPSKDQRDWSKFTAPWYKNERNGKFDPKTLKAFDKVIIRHDALYEWEASLFSHRNIYYENEDIYSFCTVTDRCAGDCIPYNDETKHLVGTHDEVPEFYKYWEV